MEMKCNTKTNKRNIYTFDVGIKVKHLGITRKQLLNEVKTIMKLDKVTAGDVKTIVNCLIFFRDNYKKTIKKYKDNFGDFEREFLENMVVE